MAAQLSQSQDRSEDVAAVAMFLSKQQGVAVELVKFIADDIHNCADDAVEPIEASIDVGGSALLQVLQDPALDSFLVQAGSAYLDDGGFIAIQDSLYEIAMDGMVSELENRGLASNLSREFCSSIIVRCVQFLQEQHDLEYRVSELATEIWEEIQHTQELDDFFDISKIASEASRRLMAAFSERLETAGELLVYQAFVEFVNEAFTSDAT